MKVFPKVFLVLLVSFFMLGFNNVVNAAAVAVSLGSATDFAILAGSGITNTGPTTITGDIGTFPTTTITGLGSITLNGNNHAGDSVTQGAKTDLVTAYNSVAAELPVTTVPVELGGTTKTTGVYKADAGTFGITGTLTLNAEGDASAVFVFLMDSTLTTANSSVVSLTNGAQACNVYWLVASSATLGTNSTFKGNILAMASVTLTTGASVQGRVLARNAAVTMDSNTVTVAYCAGAARVTPLTSTSTASSNSSGSLLTNTSGGADINTQGFPWNVVIVTLAGITTLSLIYEVIKRRKIVTKV